jgi:hypothetical protein
MFINRDATPTVSIKDPRSIGYEWCMHAKQTNAQTHKNTHRLATNHTHPHTHKKHTRMRALTHAHTHAHAHTRTQAHTHAHTSTRTLPRAHIHTHTSTHTQESPIGDAHAKAMGAPIGRVGSDKIGKETARLIFAQPRCYIELTTALRNQEPPALADASGLSNPGADVGVSRCRMWASSRADAGVSRCRCGRVPEQMWAQSRRRRGAGDWQGSGESRCSVGKQRLSAAQALARAGVCANARACVRPCVGMASILSLYGTCFAAASVRVRTRARRFMRVRKCVCACVCARSGDRACM